MGKGAPDLINAAEMLKNDLQEIIENHDCNAVQENIEIPFAVFQIIVQLPTVIIILFLI